MFWDKVAGVYDLFIRFINRKTCAGLQEMMATLVRPDDEVLECACGTGLLTGVMAERSKRLTATDFSPRMLLQAEKKFGGYANIAFQQANILALDFLDESFDVVVAANVIHLLDEPHKALAELYRVCRRGGRIVIPTYMNQNKRGELTGFVKALSRVNDVFRRQFTMETYQRFFEEAGCPGGEYTLIEGRIPCGVAVLTKA